MSSRKGALQNRLARSQRASSADTEPTLSAQHPAVSSPQSVVQARFGHSFARQASTPAAAAVTAAFSPAQTIQRQGIEEEEELQMKADSTVQRQGLPEDEELQMKADPAVQ